MTRSKFNPNEQGRCLVAAENAQKRKTGDLCGDCHERPRAFGDWLCKKCRTDQKQFIQSEMDHNTLTILGDDWIAP